MSAAFERRGELVEFSPTRLAAVDTVYAMTIHKSQGSQFDTAAVLLPDPTSRILTRELLYTAVTRARERLILAGTEEAPGRGLAPGGAGVGAAVAAVGRAVGPRRGHLPCYADLAHENRALPLTRGGGSQAGVGRSGADASAGGPLRGSRCASAVRCSARCRARSCTIADLITARLTTILR